MTRAATGARGGRGAGGRAGIRIDTVAVVALTLALAALYLAARDHGPFQAVEGQTLDWRFRLRGPQPVSADLVLVAVDDRSLAELGRWPFSRGWLAAAVDAVAADGAASIVLDMLLAGAERSGSPPGGPAADELAGPAAGGADARLAAAIRRAGTVTVPFAFVYEPGRANAAELPDAARRAAYPIVRAQAGVDAGAAGPAGDPAADPADDPVGALLPLREFLEAGGPAHATVFVDADGGLRLAHPAIRHGDAYYPSLPVEGVRRFLGLARQQVALDLGAALSLGDRRFPLGPGLTLAINYAGAAGAFETWSFIDVVRGRFPPGTFRGRLVLLGSDAAGLSDRFETPFSPALPGVEVHANVVDNLLGRGFVERSPRTVLADLLAIGLAGLLVAALGLLRSPVAAMLWTGGLVVLWAAACLHAFVAWQVWLNLLFPSLAVLLGGTVVTAALAVRESRGRSSAEARGASLERYVSPLAISDLQAREGRRAPGGTRAAAVMFVDLVGFTGAAETLPPEAAARLLRRFHGCVEELARDEGGIVDKFVGDAALVVFGLPDRGEADAAGAVACARRLVDTLAGWRGEGADAAAVRCGVGIDYGPVSLAEVGGRTHAQITVTGDTVNVASRLQALTRDWATAVIVTDAVARSVRAAGRAAVLDGFRALPEQTVRGRRRPLRLWAWQAPSGE